MKKLTSTCEDVIRDLSLAKASGAVSASSRVHLETCPECSQWAASAAILDLYHQTKPIEPSEAAWNQVWSNLSARLDELEAVSARPVTSHLAPRLGPLRRHRRTLAFVGFGLAQAAAVLLFLAHGRNANQVDPAVSVAKAEAETVTSIDVEIEAGEKVLIHYDGSKLKKVDLVYDIPASAIDPNYDLLNTLEALVN